MRISPEPVGATEAERLANSYLGALRSHQYSTVDGYVSYLPDHLQDEVELLIGQKMRFVMACQRMANAFRRSEEPIDQGILKVLDEPVKLQVNEKEFEEIIKRLPVESIAEQSEPTVLKLTNGSVITVE